MEGDLVIVMKLICLLVASKKSFDVLNSFLSFLRKYERRKTHNMFYLMVNPKLKTLI
jgi:hypothetical protein